MIFEMSLNAMGKARIIRDFVKRKMAEYEGLLKC